MEGRAMPSDEFLRRLRLLKGETLPDQFGKPGVHQEIRQVALVVTGDDVFAWEIRCMHAGRVFFYSERTHDPDRALEEVEEAAREENIDG